MGASDVEKAKKQSSLGVQEDLTVAVPEDWSMPAQIRHPEGRFRSFLQLFFSSKIYSYHFKVFLEARVRSCDFPDVAPASCRRIQATAATRWKRACT
jgi:hypothetical protein